MIPIVAPSESTDIGRDELAWLGAGADGLDLYPLIVTPGVGNKAAMVQEQARIAGLVVQRNLVPRAVSLRPVCRGPGIVQGIQAALAMLEPVLKLPACVGIEGLVGVLIVDLPSDHVRVVAETLGQVLHNVATEGAI